MAEYKIYFTTGASTAVTVEAESAEEASELAADKLPRPLCHQCACDVDLGEWELDEKALAEDYPDEA